MACGMCRAWSARAAEGGGESADKVQRSTDGRRTAERRSRTHGQTAERRVGLDGGVVVSAAAASYRSRSCALGLPTAADTCINCTHSSSDSVEGRRHDNRQLRNALTVTKTQQWHRDNGQVHALFAFVLRSKLTQDKAGSYIQWLSRREAGDERLQMIYDRRQTQSGSDSDDNQTIRCHYTCIGRTGCVCSSSLGPILEHNTHKTTH